MAKFGKWVGLGLGWALGGPIGMDTWSGSRFNF